MKTARLFEAEERARRPTEMDWDAIERSEVFRELVTCRRRFVVPTTLLALGWWLAFLLLVGYARRVHGLLDIPGPHRRVRTRA